MTHDTYKPRVFVLTSRLYEVAGGRTKATIERMMFLSRHFDATLIEMSATKYPGAELPAVFAKYETKFNVINPWLASKANVDITKNYLELLKEKTGSLGDEKIFAGAQESFVLPTLSGGSIKSYIEDGKIVRLREYHPDGTVDFFALDEKQNILLRELHSKDQLLSRYYVDTSGKISSGFVVEASTKKYVYRKSDDTLVYSDDVSDHNLAFLSDTLRAGDVLISDVRYYDNLLQQLDPKIRKIHVWHEIVTNLSEKYALNPEYKTIVKPTYPLADTDKIVVFTDDTRTEYADSFPHLADHITVIPYGTTIKPAIKGVARDKNIIISIGRLQASQKNVSAQIKAFKIFHEKYPETLLKIFGEGDDLHNLVTLTQKLHLEDSVLFGGFSHKTGEEFQRAGMMIFSSNQETFGLTLLESLSNGTPVASYDVRFGAKAMIKDGHNGVIAKQNTPKALADAMVRLRQLNISTRRVKSSIKSTFSKENFESKWLAIITGDTPKTTPKKLVAVMPKKAATLAPILAEHKGFMRQIWSLAWMGLQKSYRGALLGWSWVIVQPLIMLGFYWFIIAIGLHSDTVAHHHYQYLPWLVAGLCSWFFISDMINAGVGAFRRYAFLITKTRFPVATIPLVVVISNLIVHILLLAPVLVYLCFSDYLAVQWVQLPLYIILSAVMMWAWSLFAAPLGAISKDFTQLIKSLLRVLVWLSGILWDVRNVHIHWLREIMKLNPIYFLAEGYRKSLIYHQWFFKNWHELTIFMSELGVLVIIATVVYKRSRKELVDVL